VIKLRSVAAQYCKSHNGVPKEGWDWWRLKTVSTIFPPTVPLLSLEHVIWRMQIWGVSELRIVGFWGSAAHFMIGDWLRRSVEIISEMWVPIICTILAVSSINCIFLSEHTDQNCLLDVQISAYNLVPLLMLAVFCRSSRVMCSRLWEAVTSRASPWSRVFLHKDVCGFWCTEVCSSLPCRPESRRLVACYGIWRIVQIFLTYFKD